MNIPVSAYNPSQKERFRKRLILFYSVHDQEGSGRVSNALSLKIPEAMVMSGLYSKYNVHFEDEEKAARQKGLLPEQQQHFNSELYGSGVDGGDNAFDGSTDGGTTSHGRGSRINTNSTLSQRAGSMISNSNLQHMRSHAASLSGGHHNNNVDFSDFAGTQQQSYGNFSASPSMSSYPPANHQQQDSPLTVNNNNSPSVTIAANNRTSSDASSYHPETTANDSPASNNQQQQNLRRRHSSAYNMNNNGNFPSAPPPPAQASELPVVSLPEPERQRVQKRVDRFYQKYFPEGAWKAQEARSSPMTESDLFESLCSSYKVDLEEERILAADLLPDGQGAAAETIKTWYEEKLKKLEAQHKQELQEEQTQRKKLQQEKENLKLEREKEIDQIRMEQVKLQIELRDYDDKLSLSKIEIEEKEAEIEKLIKEKRQRSSSENGNNNKQNGEEESPTSSAVEAQLAFLKSELETAKKYAESLENVHKAEMQDKELELLQRLHEKAALERKLSEDSQMSPPSRRDLLYPEQKERELQKQRQEDEDAPPGAPPPEPSAASPVVSKEPTVSERRYQERMDRFHQNHQQQQTPQSLSRGISETNSHQARFSSFIGEGSPLRKMFSQNNSHGTLSTPASPVRIRGHASPEHPLLVVCGICGEQGRERFCHNCGANYEGQDYTPES